MVAKLGTLPKVFVNARILAIAGLFKEKLS
jgi:hypothetical protein